MSGQKINDHSSWMGKGSKGHVFPDGPHKTKMESSANGAGKLEKYEDTTEAIRSQQEAGERKIKGHAHKPGTRN